MPYLARVFRNRPVARERTNPRQIEYSLSRPYFRMLILSRNTRLDIDIGAEIRHQEVVIAINQHVANPSEQSRLAGTKSIGRQLVEDPLESRVRIVVIARAVCALQRQVLD